MKDWSARLEGLEWGEVMEGVGDGGGGQAVKLGRKGTVKVLVVNVYAIDGRGFVLVRVEEEREGFKQGTLKFAPHIRPGITKLTTSR